MIRWTYYYGAEENKNDVRFAIRIVMPWYMVMK